MLTDLAEGATAVHIQQNRQNMHLLRSALFRVLVVGTEPLADIAAEWLFALDELISGQVPVAEYLDTSRRLQARIITAARPLVAAD